ncbi:Lrp/AsnC ligand binding domain-containing protein [Marinomonas sp. C2222]|uniref:Leucine-responsive regulatory protein n=1 Tax=Marinomonas sargassi TaxID=2984494 RepID=A0ABT2YRF3_9GAMM|nr:Lrp/AsnC ligand binding domain-containing protein [Marinomonas sargassi]MCV2402472.1 Lrp/AsnC ligand binding domain-containing protein [Marinomonas sargassi]
MNKVDKKILQLLQKDGRLTNADLSEKVNVSPATCHRRTSQLFKDGYISETRAIIAPEKVDRSTLVLVGVVLDRSTQESFASFESAIKKFSFILDCYLVAGDFDYFLKVRVKDMAGFNKLHSSQLLDLPSVRQLRTFFVMKEVQDNAPLSF